MYPTVLRWLSFFSQDHNVCQGAPIAQSLCSRCNDGRFPSRQTSLRVSWGLSIFVCQPVTCQKVPFWFTRLVRFFPCFNFCFSSLKVPNVVRLFPRTFFPSFWVFLDVFITRILFRGHMSPLRIFLWKLWKFSESPPEHLMRLERTLTVDVPFLLELRVRFYCLKSFTGSFKFFPTFIFLFWVRPYLWKIVLLIMNTLTVLKVWTQFLGAPFF